MSENCMSKIDIIIIFSLAFILKVNAMNYLPLELTENIISKFVSTDVEDIPLVMSQVMALALTSKNLHEQTNNPLVVKKLFTTMSEQFQMHLYDICAEVNSPISFAFLKDHLPLGQLQLYEAVPKILKIVEELLSVFKPLGLSSDESVVSINSNPMYHETKQGLFLVLCVTPFLETPWGLIKLVTGELNFTAAYLAFCQEFFKRCKLSFILTEPLKYIEQEEFYKITRRPILRENLLPDLGADMISTLTGEQISLAIGTDNIIFNRIKSKNTRYTIMKVEDQVLPEAELVKDKKKCLQEGKLLAFLQKHYAIEKGITESDKKLSGSDVSLKRRFISMKQIPNVIIEILQEFEDQPYIHKIDIQKQNVYEMNKNPIVPFQLSKDSKFLPFENREDRDIFVNFCFLKDDFIDEGDSQSCTMIGPHYRGWSVRNHETYEKYRGLLLSLYVAHFSFALDSLRIAFQNMMTRICCGWKHAKLVDHSTIKHRESEEEWQLLMKKKIFNSEHRFIFFAAKTFGLLHSISLNIYNERNPLCYLWVKKKDFDTVVKLLNLTIV